MIITKGLEPQVLFDRVKKHLLEQDKKSAKEFTCLYRGPNGTKCAVGCLISDEIYDDKMEHNTVLELFRDYPILKDYIGAKNLPLVASLQRVHDNSRPEDWVAKLSGVAKEYGLKSM